MYKSFKNIILKQQRKGISSIINGVHIVPDVLYDFAENQKIIFINLYINNENELHKRIIERDPNSYLLSHVPMLFTSNIELHLRTLELSNKVDFAFNSIDITSLNIVETLEIIENCLKNRIGTGTNNFAQ